MTPNSARKFSGQAKRGRALGGGVLTSPAPVASLQLQQMPRLPTSQHLEAAPERKKMPGRLWEHCSQCSGPSVADLVDIEGQHLQLVQVVQDLRKRG